MPQTLDLDALGAKTASQPPPPSGATPPSGGSGLDLDALGATSHPAPTPSAAPDTRTWGPAHQMFAPLADAMGRAGKWVADQAHAGDKWYSQGEFGAGAEKGAAETLTGLAHLMGSTEGATPEQLEAQTGWESAGKLGENILEFIGGDEAFKALSMAGQLSEVARVGKLVEKYPLLAEAIQRYPKLARLTGRLAAHVPAATRQAAVSTAQTLVKTGGDAKAAMEAGGTQLLLGTAMPEVLSDAEAQIAERAKNVAPRTATVAGEQVQIPREVPLSRNAANAQRIVTKTGQELVRPHLEALSESARVPEEPSVVRPAAGQEAINAAELGSTAATVPERIMRPIPTEAPIEPPLVRAARGKAQREVGSMAATVPERVMRSATSPATEPVAKPPSFEPIDVPSRLRSFGSLTEGLDNLEEEAVNRYDKIADKSELSGGRRDEYTGLRRQFKQDRANYRSAVGTENQIAAEAKMDASKQAIDDLLKEHGMKPEEYDAANQAYGASKNLRPVAKAIDRFADANYQGTTLKTDLAKIARDKPQVKDLIGRDHWSALETASTLNQSKAVKNVADWLKKIGVPESVATGAGLSFGWEARHMITAHPYVAVGAGLTIAAGKAIMNSPKALTFLNYAIKNGVKPEIYAPIVSRIIMDDRKQQQEQTQ